MKIPKTPSNPRGAGAAIIYIAATCLVAYLWGFYSAVLCLLTILVLHIINDRGKKTGRH